MARYRNVCWTLNNPEDMVVFEPEKMSYLVYQEEIGDSGTYHFQGYCEFTDKVSLNPAKLLLGGVTVHLERRRGSQQQAIDYCKDPAKRVAHTEPYEYGEPKAQGKRQDIESFKEDVFAGAKLAELVEDHCGTLARYPRFYNVLKFMHSPVRTKELQVTLLIGETGTGKTRWVYDHFGASEDFWRAPLTNGTMWFDTYDGHSVVLFDDFSGASSHVSLCTLLQLLDRYPVKVPTKGGHVWFMPDEVFVTTNLLPRLWYKWRNRMESYDALGRRFHKVCEYYVSLPGAHSSFTVATDTKQWFEQNKPDEALYLAQ